MNNDKIAALILTRNRACQSRLLLESLKANATGIFEPYLLYKADSSEYQRAYNMLSQDIVGTNFLIEKDLLDEIYFFLENIAGSHVAFFMDDCIFYRELRKTARELVDLFDDNTWSLSLRLGYNTTENNKKQIKPIQQEDGFLKYNFKNHDATDNYGFTFSWDGHIYNTEKLLKFFDRNDFSNTTNPDAILPQRIENFSTHNRDKIEEELVCCPKHSHVVCMNYNTTHPKANFNYYPIEELNQKYLTGKIIDYQTINFDEITGTHAYRPFIMRPMN